MQISIPDDLYQSYVERSKAEHKPVLQLLTEQLRRHLDTPITQRHVTLTGHALEAVETLLGGGSLLSVDDLLSKIRRWAGISIGDVRLSFSPAQLEEIQWRAGKQGKTPAEVAEDLVKQIEPLVFNGPTVMR